MKSRIVVRNMLPAVLSGLMLAAHPAAAQTLGQASDVEISFWRVSAALGLCIVLAVAGAFFLKARQGGAPLALLLPKRDRRLRLVEALRLSPQADLCIVECDGQELLIAASPHGTRLLAKLPLQDGGGQSGRDP